MSSKLEVLFIFKTYFGPLAFGVIDGCAVRSFFSFYFFFLFFPHLFAAVLSFYHMLRFVTLDLNNECWTDV